MSNHNSIMSDAILLRFTAEPTSLSRAFKVNH